MAFLPKDLDSPLDQRLPRRRTTSRMTRTLFALAVLTFGFATIYTGLGLIRRAWPAIFPGQRCTVCSLVVDLGPARCAPQTRH